MSPGKTIFTLVTRTAARIFDKHLFTINTFSGSVLMCVGDIAQQNVERYHGLSDSYDWTRTGKLIYMQAFDFRYLYSLLDFFS